MNMLCSYVYVYNCFDKALERYSILYLGELFNRNLRCVIAREKMRISDAKQKGT